MFSILFLVNTLLCVAGIYPDNYQFFSMYANLIQCRSPLANCIDTFTLFCRQPIHSSNMCTFTVAKEAAGPEKENHVNIYLQSLKFIIRKFC